jgi:hypothetical protein
LSEDFVKEFTQKFPVNVSNEIIDILSQATNYALYNNLYGELEANLTASNYEQIDRLLRAMLIDPNILEKVVSPENVELAKGKAISVNNIKLIDEKELGPTITKSNLREVGRLKGLIVDGGLSVNQYLVYDPNTDRLGIGTDQPKATLSIVDQNIELVFGASEPNVGSIGTFNSVDLELVTDNTARITIQAGGNIILGNPATGDTKVTILGKLGINVSNPDPRSALHVNGALKFNDKLHLNGSEPPSSGAFNEGDVVWNTYPQPGKFVGWVCTKSGNPGIWSGFGRIE